MICNAVTEVSGTEGHMKNSYKLARSEWIVKGKDYKAVMSQGVRQVSRYFVILGMPSPQRRAGIIVSKKVGGSVERHLVKRRMRECYRHLPDLMIASKRQMWLMHGWPKVDMVIIARRQALEASYHSMSGDLLTGILGMMSKLPYARSSYQPRSTPLKLKIKHKDKETHL